MWNLLLDQSQKDNDRWQTSIRIHKESDNPQRLLKTVHQTPPLHSSLGKTRCFQHQRPLTAHSWLQLTRSCVKTSFASKQLVFVFPPKFPENGSVLPAVAATQLAARKTCVSPQSDADSLSFIIFNGMVVRAAKEDEKGDAGDSVVIWVGECFFRSARQVLVAPLLLCPMKSACTRKNANVPQETHASLSIYWVRWQAPFGNCNVQTTTLSCRSTPLQLLTTPPNHHPHSTISNNLTSAPVWLHQFTKHCGIKLSRAVVAIGLTETQCHRLHFALHWVSLSPCDKTAIELEVAHCHCTLGNDAVPMTMQNCSNMQCRTACRWQPPHLTTAEMYKAERCTQHTFYTRHTLHILLRSTFCKGAYQ